MDYIITLSLWAVKKSTYTNLMILRFLPFLYHKPAKPWPVYRVISHLVAEASQYPPTSPVRGTVMGWLGLS